MSSSSITCDMINIPTLILVIVKIIVGTYNILFSHILKTNQNDGHFITAEQIISNLST